MISLVVALVVQVLWEVVRAVLEQTVVTVTDPRISRLAFGIAVASALVAAAAAGDLARRTTGARRVGSWIAAVAYLLIVGCTAVREGLLYVAQDNAHAAAWILTMHHYGWRMLEVLAVLGIAIAAGRRGLWLAPPALGLAVIAARPGFVATGWPQDEAILFVTARIALVLVMAIAAERGAAQREPAPDRAKRGLRLAELAAWIGAVMSITWALPGLYASSEPAAVLVVGASLVVDGMFASGMWMLAQANLWHVTVPRWPLWLSVVATIWGSARYARTWLVTFARHGTSWDQTHFTMSHWSGSVPGAIACGAALAALVVLARRSQSREALPAALFAAAAVLVVFGLRIAVPDQRQLMAACYIVTNLLAVRAYRTARTSLDMGIAPARVINAS